MSNFEADFPRSHHNYLESSYHKLQIDTMYPEVNKLQYFKA